MLKIPQRIPAFRFFRYTKINIKISLSERVESMQETKKIRLYERGISMMTLSSICVSIFGLFAKLSMMTYSLTTMVALRFVGPLLITIPYFLYAKTFKHLKHNISYSKHFFRAFVVVVCQYSLFFYLTKASLTNAVMLWNTSPIFIPLIARVLFKDRVGKVAWISIFLGLFGIICILQPEKKIFDPFSFWGLFSGFTMALSQVLYGHNRESSRTDVNVFYLYFFTSIITLFVLFVFNGFIKGDLLGIVEPLFVEGVRPYIYIVIISIGSIGNQFLRGSAYSFATPSFLSPFIYLSVLFSGFLDWLIFHEVPNFLFVVGCILVTFSIFIRIAFSHKH